MKLLCKCTKKITTFVSKPIAKCIDPVGLKEKLVSKKSCDEGDVLCKLNIDGGGGFLKVNMNLINVFKHFKDSSRTEDIISSQR